MATPIHYTQDTYTLYKRHLYGLTIAILVDVFSSSVIRENNVGATPIPIFMRLLTRAAANIQMDSFL